LARQKHRIIIYFLLFVLFLNCIPQVSGTFEDLSTYDEVDPQSKFTFTGTTRINYWDIESDMTGNYVLKNFSEGYFGDYIIEWEFYVPNSAEQYQTGVTFCLSNEYGDVTDINSTWAGFYISGASGRPVWGYWGHYNGSYNASKDYLMNKQFIKDALYYCRFSRDNSTVNFSAFTDSARTNIFSYSEQSGVANTTYKTMYVGQSYGHGTSNTVDDFYCKNFEVIQSRAIVPDAPTNPVLSFTEPDIFNLSWTKDTNANNTVVVMREDRFPTSITDGAIWYNGTGNTFENVTTNQLFYLRAWSSSNWSNPNDYRVSDNYATFDFGGITLSCYDENTSEAITGWGVFISNADHTLTYENTSTSNGLFLNIYQFPYGLDTIFVFSKSGYEDRIYYYDIDITVNQNYTINAYLPQDTELYQLFIQNQFSEPVDKVKVYVSRYINSTVGYENVSLLLTDSNGQVMVNLIPNELYSIRLNKSGWQNSNFDFTPSDQLFTYYFRIIPDETVYQNETPYHEVVTFDGYKDGSTGYINFIDASSNSINISIYVYEINSTTGNVTGFYWYNATAPANIQTSFTLNNSNTYRVDLFLYHSVYGVVLDSFFLYHTKAKKTSTEEFEDIMTDVFGNNPLTWSGILGIFVLLAGLFSFGSENVGVSIILTGFIMLGINAIGITLLAVGICIIIVLFGIMVQWRRERRRH